MNKVERIKELTKELQEHCVAYYKHDKPIITDKEYDLLYDELATLEKETGFILSSSPTQKVQGELLDDFEKVEHTNPMLSAQKTKESTDILNFIGNETVVFSHKLDGLTIVLRYNEGKLIQGITRGTGLIGEDVTLQCKQCANIPLSIPFKGYLEIRGECIISLESFEKINSVLNDEEKYSHPRNLAAGSIRQKDTSLIKDRCLEFIAFGIPSGDVDFSEKYEQLIWLDKQGFDVVYFTILKEIIYDHNEITICCLDPYGVITIGTIEDTLLDFKIDFKNFCKHPIDGVICEISNLESAKSKGSTSHHPLNMIAYKFEDATYETILKDIQWETSRNGTLYPTALFDNVDIDGANITKCTLHNIDFIEGLELGIGDIVEISRRNMVIPHMENNITRSNTYKLPTHCPSCGTELLKMRPDKTSILCCPNKETCPAQLLQKFVHFVSRKALNIDGLSEATLEKCISMGWVNSFKDLYHLDRYKDEFIKTDGFGGRSYEKLITAIDNTRTVKLESFIVGLGINNIGTSASKSLSKYFNGDFDTFYDSVLSTDFTTLEDFGEGTHNSIVEFFTEENKTNWVKELANEFEFIIPQLKQEVEDNVFKDKTFCVTGSFTSGSRDELKLIVENLGGKFVSSVSKNTNILLCGEKAGSKKDKAIQCGVRIIEEKEFIEIIEK